MLLLFNELEVKETAYKTIIRITDEGYPFQIRKIYIYGDIETKIGYCFINNYNFYKAYVNEKKGLHKWAEHYFAKIDKDNFPKYLLYKAINLYEDNKPYDALQILKRILKFNLKENQAAFAKKTARTMARIYFELEEYELALDIYKNFLLKTNPIRSTDWLETAWTLYHLKYYNRALGMLYNLESKTFGEVIHLEKFIIRALIYRKLCQTDLMDGLLTSFIKKFGYIIEGVKQGKPITGFKGLDVLSSEQNKEYFKYRYLYKKLSEEYNDLLDKKQNDNIVLNMGLYKYLISTEKSILNKNAQMFEDKSKHQAVKYLVLLYENLRFLKYDVVLEKFNPNTIFIKPEKINLDSTSKEKKIFSFYWPQDGAYWADERLYYKTWLKNLCQNEEKSGE
jgi:tetratricopeptide (TPR) repeat protein